MVVTTESCPSNGPSNLSQVFLCYQTTLQPTSYSTSYSWFSLSTNYDPWFDIAPNGRSWLFAITAFASVIFAVLVIAQGARKRHLLLGACLAGGLVVTSLVVNLMQLSRFDDQWTRQTCRGAAWCGTVTQPAVAVTVVLSIVLVMALVISASTLDPDVPRPPGWDRVHRYIASPEEIAGNFR